MKRFTIYLDNKILENKNFDKLFDSLANKIYQNFSNWDPLVFVSNGNIGIEFSCGSKKNVIDYLNNMGFSFKLNI